MPRSYFQDMNLGDCLLMLVVMIGGALLGSAEGGFSLAGNLWPNHLCLNTFENEGGREGGRRWMYGG